MSNLEHSQMPSQESIQRFNSLVDLCLEGMRPFELAIEDEQETATAVLPLPDPQFVHPETSSNNVGYLPQIVSEHLVTAERHLSAARAIRRLRIIDVSADHTYPRILETATDEPGITFRYEDPLQNKLHHTIDDAFLKSQLARVNLGIQFRQAGH